MDQHFETLAAALRSASADRVDDPSSFVFFADHVAGMPRRQKRTLLGGRCFVWPEQVPRFTTCCEPAARVYGVDAADPETRPASFGPRVRAATNRLSGSSSRGAAAAALRWAAAARNITELQAHSLVRWGRTSRCRRARLSQSLIITPAPLVSDSPSYQKPESGESRR
jgi:hypothetical protein